MSELTPAAPPEVDKDVRIRQLLSAKVPMHKIASEVHCSLERVSAVKKSEVYTRASIHSQKKVLPGRLYEIASLAINAITPAKLAAASAPQLITTAAIAIDKARLMEGLSTENMDIRSIVPKIEEQLEVTARAQAEVIELIRQRGGSYAAKEQAA